jgi:hypothetical protein
MRMLTSPNHDMTMALKDRQNFLMDTVKPADAGFQELRPPAGTSD